MNRTKIGTGGAFVDGEMGENVTIGYRSGPIESSVTVERADLSEMLVAVLGRIRPEQRLLTVAAVMRACGLVTPEGWPP